MFVAKEHQSQIDQPITAWMGHDAPFDFSIDYAPAKGITRLLSGTPMIVSMATLEAGLDLWSQIDLSLVRAKSIVMSECFIRIIESRLGDSTLKLASPRDAAQRGSHVAFQHPHGYEVIQAMAEQGVIGDFREPDLIRFGIAPLYLRFTDVWFTANMLSDVVQTGSWDQPRYRQRAAVT
jgi:kynureninase